MQKRFINSIWEEFFRCRSVLSVTNLADTDYWNSLARKTKTRTGNNPPVYYSEIWVPIKDRITVAFLPIVFQNGADVYGEWWKEFVKWNFWSG